ncbi:MAG: hypothetical protein Q9174_006488 [Haloplaca sp. 1 TL-2023]
MESSKSSGRVEPFEIKDDEKDSDVDVRETSCAVWESATKKRRLLGPENPPRQTSISPPPRRNAVSQINDESLAGQNKPGNEKQEDGSTSLPTPTKSDANPQAMASPIQLSTVNGLPTASNIDTVSLHDILGDPLIKECWLFNYLFDVDFVMQQLDKDTRDLVKVKIVHGSWRSEDSNRINIEVQFSQSRSFWYKTPSDLHSSILMPPKGTHHCKMIILFRHDDLAQVNIVTGNFIVRDWSMCQAVWRSSLLPIQKVSSPQADPPAPFHIGSGPRFKQDLLAYLKFYGQRRTGSLTVELSKYDFSSIRAALIASVPGKQNLRSIDPNRETLWGWPALRHILTSIKPHAATSKPHIVMQCSSVASVGEKWMKETFMRALSASKASPPSTPKPKFSLIFPTPDEIRRSIDGYDAGGSIHMNVQKPAQAKQLEFLRPMLCHWAGDHDSLAAGAKEGESKPVRQALRRRAAPHIKTYIRFSDEQMTRIDWAVMTSANLSKQAWGEAANATGDVRICSYEIGVAVWPALWDDGGETEMVPVFGKDTPDKEDMDSDIAVVDEKGETLDDDTTDEEGGKGLRKQEPERQKVARKRVGLRMPYDLPLVSYGKDEMPWCKSLPHMEPDWMGRSWPGTGG